MSTAALRRFARDDSGIAVTEYGLLIALVADVIESAANHEPTTEAGLAERGLPTKSGPL